MLFTDLVTSPPTEEAVTELLRNVAIAPGGAVHDVLGQVSTITGVQVQVVWSPPWDPDRDMTAAAKELLGWRR